ncbi:MAG: hypothetical protein R2867_00995 [Caldilineaceae bacterium]
MCKHRPVENVLKFARGSMYLGVTGDEWDGNANLLGVKNGVVNLMTGEPVQPSPDQYIRTVALYPISLAQSAHCGKRRWTAFLTVTQRKRSI